jgi:hypothetical protein
LLGFTRHFRVHFSHSSLELLLILISCQTPPPLPS